MTTILNQFKEYTESLQSLTKMQKIPRLMTADKFKELVNVQLQEILRFQISSDNDNKNSKDIFKEISKTSHVNALDPYQLLSYQLIRLLKMQTMYL